MGAELPKILDRLYDADPTNTRLAYERGAVYLGLARTAPAGSPEREAAAHVAVTSYERASADAKIAEESLVGLATSARLAGDQGARPARTRSSSRNPATPGTRPC